MHGILCHVAYAKGFPVHILCCTNLRCWAADLFTGGFIKSFLLEDSHSKMLFIAQRLVVIYTCGFYSFVPIAISFLGNSAQMPKCRSNSQVLSVNSRHILVFLPLLMDNIKLAVIITITVITGGLISNILNKCCFFLYQKWIKKLARFQ